MTITELYVDSAPQETDGDGDVWTLAEDGRYSLGTVRRKHGETTLANIRRAYGLSSD